VVATSGRQSTLAVGSSLKFTPITVCWRDLSYYVPVPKGLTGAAALNVMPLDAEEDIAGKKRLLNSITGEAVIRDCALVARGWASCCCPAALRASCFVVFPLSVSELTR
jgi:hypothetical protein